MAIYWKAPDDLLGKYYELAGVLVQVVGFEPDAGRLKLKWTEGPDGAAWVTLEWWNQAVSAGMVLAA